MQYVMFPVDVARLESMCSFAVFSIFPLTSLDALAALLLVDSQLGPRANSWLAAGELGEYCMK